MRIRKRAKCRAVLEEDLFILHPWLRIGKSYVAVQQALFVAVWFASVLLWSVVVLSHSFVGASSPRRTPW